MKKLIDIIEGLKIGSKTKVNKYSCKPKDKDELRKIIEERLKQNKNADLNDIDVSDITDMANLFYKLEPYTYNIDISKWDVSNVKYMNAMFFDCSHFNSDLSSWDVSNVENMRSMFFECQNFNSNLKAWNVSKVEDMYYMFNGCENFNSDLSGWDVSKVKNIGHMFYYCKKFDSNLNNWDVSNVEEMRYMIYRCDSLKNKPDWYKGRII